MTRYQLAKLVAWAEQLRTRKRLQKVVYMLQAAGCPLGADFTLHHYGPYSSEVARLSDEMVHSKLLAEELEKYTLGQQYSYRLSDQARQQIVELEATARGKEWAKELAPFEVLARELLRADLKELEVASTVAYFRRQGFDWPEAVERTCSFKDLPPSNNLVKRAEELARRVLK